MLKNEPARQKRKRLRDRFVFASIEMTGTLKKFPIASRNRCSSTLPESSTCAVHEPPFRFEASCSGFLRDGTPLASRRSMSDLLSGGIHSAALRQMQGSPNRNRERAGHAHRVILLHAGDRV